MFENQNYEEENKVCNLRLSNFNSTILSILFPREFYIKNNVMGSLERGVGLLISEISQDKLMHVSSTLVNK